MDLYTIKNKMLFKIYFIYSQQNDVDTFFKPKQCNGFFLVKIWFKRGVIIGQALT